MMMTLAMTMTDGHGRTTATTIRASRLLLMMMMMLMMTILIIMMSWRRVDGRHTAAVVVLGNHVPLEQLDLLAQAHQLADVIVVVVVVVVVTALLLIVVLIIVIFFYFFFFFFFFIIILGATRLIFGSHEWPPVIRSAVAMAATLADLLSQHADALADLLDCRLLLVQVGAATRARLIGCINRVVVVVVVGSGGGGGIIAFPPLGALLFVIIIIIVVVVVVAVVERVEALDNGLHLHALVGDAHRRLVPHVANEDERVGIQVADCRCIALQYVHEMRCVGLDEALGVAHIDVEALDDTRRRGHRHRYF